MLETSVNHINSDDRTDIAEKYIKHYAIQKTVRGTMQLNNIKRDPNYRLALRLSSVIIFNAVIVALRRRQTLPLNYILSLLFYGQRVERQLLMVNRCIVKNIILAFTRYILSLYHIMKTNP